MSESRPPFPPSHLDTALRKVQAAEDAWNTRDPDINDRQIDESERRIFGPRPESKRGIEVPVW